jgi:catechol 2,3-dioxygenase-like lactoylglutathione lyase family enzyme
MSQMTLHHVSIVTTNLERSLAFYRDLFQLNLLQRPQFPSSGAWLDCGGLQLHLIVNPSGTFRDNRSVDYTDGHFALRTNDFEGFVKRAIEMGFKEDADVDDPSRLLVVREGAAGFPQVYILDPDRNIIEVNAVA